MKQVLNIDQKRLLLKQVYDSIEHQTQISLAKPVIQNVEKSRTYLDQKLKSGGTYYGINTGFGALYNKVISKSQLKELQINLLRSHACGLGDYVPQPIVRLMLLSKIKSLSLGYSGISTQTLQKLIDLYNTNTLPVVYNQGSLGASGDLAPLAHLALPLIGEGEIWQNGKVTDTKKAKLKGIELQAKEGLALINGTQFMTAYALWCLYKMDRLFSWSNTIAALSFDAFYGNPDALYEGIMNVRHHEGQKHVAKSMLKHLSGSDIQKRGKKELQDPYSFRCIPQVHGASYDVIQQVKTTIEHELNAVSDNPLIFADDNKIVSGGNFHGQPIALALESLGLAVAELASISERRIYKLISGQRELPSFLVKEPGINSGLMIPQYVAASIVSQNKQLCTPAVVDSIDSSKGQEDHVSMGANAATKTLQIVENLEKVLAIELFVASTALSFRPYKTSSSLEKLLQQYRKVVPVVKTDRFFHADLKATVGFLNDK